MLVYMHACIDACTQEYTADSRMGLQRVHEQVRGGFARVREGYADGFTTDTRRIRRMTQILTRYSQFTAVNPSMAFVIKHYGVKPGLYIIPLYR